MPLPTDPVLKPRAQLRDLIDEWADLDAWLKARVDQPHPSPQGQPSEWDAKREQRRDLRIQIMDILEDRPELDEFAQKQGFTYSGLKTTDVGGSGGADAAAQAQQNQGSSSDDGAGSGKGGGGDGGDGKDQVASRRDRNPPNLRHQAQDNRLLGDIGKEFTLIRGPKGLYVADYVYRIEGEVVHLGIKLGKSAESLQKFGLKPADAKMRTGQQMKRIKAIGWADELAPNIRKGDGHVMKSLTRYLANQYGGQPILDDDEVMRVVIANSMFGWSAGEFENKLRQTKWYSDTNGWQRTWVTTMSDKEKKDTTNQVFVDVVNTLEDHYGLDWIKYIDGGMQQARTWAEKIASGTWGTPGEGLKYWAGLQFDKAAKIEGTNAALSRAKDEENRLRELNRPEDMFERLRSEALAWLGEDAKQTPRIDRGSLQQWANDLVSGVKSDGDWQGFLRDRMKTLFPYFDSNFSFVDQASPYKSILERTIGDTVEWNDDMLRDFSSLDANGKPTGTALSLRDFELAVRDPSRNPRAYQEGTPLFDEGMSMLSNVLYKMKGVS